MSLRLLLACTWWCLSCGQVYRHSAAINKIDPAILFIVKASDFSVHWLQDYKQTFHLLLL